MSDQQKLSEHQTPTENNSALHEAAGNLAFLLSVIRCGEQLSEAEILNVRKVIERCGKEETQLAEAIRERDAARENCEAHMEQGYKLVAENLDLQAQRDALAAALRENCSDTIAWIARHISTTLKYIPDTDQSGHPHGYSVIQIPDWEAKQKIEWLREALATLERPAPADGGRKGK